MRYNGVNATMQSLVQFAAPAAAGALLTVSTLRSALMIDIVTAVIGVGLLSLLLIPRQEIPGEQASIFADMKIGVKYAFSDKLLGKLLVAFSFFCAYPPASLPSCWSAGSMAMHTGI